MIVSTVAGRIRVRSRRLRSSGIADRVRRQVETMPGVSMVRVNTAAGCLVVGYDPQVVDTEGLEDRLEALCLPPPPARTGKPSTVSRQINRITKAGMVTTLGTSLVYGYLGRKKPHIGFGAAFLAFAGVHMLRYRGTLLR
jgi:copper chaperone CopZ